MGFVGAGDGTQGKKPECAAWSRSATNAADSSKSPPIKLSINLY